MNSLYLSLSKYIWPISIMVLALISVASLIPLPNLPEIPGNDKTHHIVSYGVVALPISIIRPRFWLVFLLFVIIWSGAIELIQPFVNRYAEWLDLLANLAGVMIGLMGGSLINRLIIVVGGVNIFE